MYLGSEFTAGSQELDTISLAFPADMKGGCGCHTWELPAQTLPLAQKMANELTVWEEMSGGALADPGLAAMAIPARGVAAFGRWIWGPCQPWIWSVQLSALLSLKENVSLQLAPQLEVPLLVHHRWPLPR